MKSFEHLLVSYKMFQRQLTYFDIIQKISSNLLLFLATLRHTYINVCYLAPDNNPGINFNLITLII